MELPVLAALYLLLFVLHFSGGYFFLNVYQYVCGCGAWVGGTEAAHNGAMLSLGVLFSRDPRQG